MGASIRSLNVAAALLLSGAYFVDAEPILLPGPVDSASLELVEKENLRRRVDGTYAGYIYREYRGILRRDGVATPATYSGVFYQLEDLSSLGKSTRRLESRVPGSITLGREGAVVTGEDLGFPKTRGFPFIPEQRFQPGDTWRAYGERIVDPSLEGRYTRVEFYCEYVYQGVSELAGADAYHIRAQYALRYRAGDDPAGDPALNSVSGSHVSDILLAADGTGRVFIRTQVTESYRVDSGQTITYEGFLLSWINDATPMDRESVRIDLVEALHESNTRDVVVETTEEGISVSLQSIHFVPDTAEILFDERERLDALFVALKPFASRTLLVVGHTADIGTESSQLELSIERAKTVIKELSGRGIPPDRFIFSGRGGTEPIAPNDVEANMAKNRRVEIIILDG